MAVNENVYGLRENWTTPNSPQNWSETDSYRIDFFNEYYPKIKTGCPQGQTDGKLIDLLNAGTITRDTVIDSSPAWVYTYLEEPHAIGYMWAPASEFTFDNLYEEGTWVGDETHNNLTPIMFQVFRHTDNTTNSYLKGMDGWYAPATNPDLVEGVKRNQAKERFSPGVTVSEEEMADAIICADDTERFALTSAQVDPMYQEVYVQSTTNMYYVKDRDKLNSEAGYQFMYSINDFVGNNSSPVVNFCPKNFILETNITYGTVVVTGNSTSPQAVKRIVPRPDGLFSSETLPLADFTEELIQQRLDDIETFIDTYPETHGGADYPHDIYLAVFGMHCKVYNRDHGDTFTHNQSGDNVNTPIFNVLFNGGLRLDTMSEDEPPLVRYVYNQPYSGRWTYCNFPLLGDIGGGTSYDINILANYSRISYWEDHPDFTWWSSHISYIPFLLGVNLRQSFYERVGDSWSGYGYRVVPVVMYIYTAGDVSVIKEKAHEVTAQYGLFFCDKYDDIATKDTPRMWTDPDMMCGTFTEQDGIRITRGNFTSGLDNMEQPQFFMVNSEGDTWDPDVTFRTNNDYPQMTSWDLMEFDEPPLPVNDVPTTANNEYPMFPYWNITPIPVEPYPYPVFVTDNNYPDMYGWGLELIGAFAGLRNLNRTKIPLTTKSIGYNAYAGTSVKEVRIAEDCDYFDESFPPGCNIIKVPTS